jgi:hypothetical protein
MICSSVKPGSPSWAEAGAAGAAAAATINHAATADKLRRAPQDDTIGVDMEELLNDVVGDGWVIEGAGITPLRVGP